MSSSFYSCKSSPAEREENSVAEIYKEELLIVLLIVGSLY